MKELAKDGGELTGDEADILQGYLSLCKQEAEAKRELKTAEDHLDELAYARYAKLNESDVKTLVVDAKWIATLEATIHGEMDRISRTITQRVKDLAERYDTPMPQLSSRVTDLERKVSSHLERMGFSWK